MIHGDAGAVPRVMRVSISARGPYRRACRTPTPTTYIQKRDLRKLRNTAQPASMLLQQKCTTLGLGQKLPARRTLVAVRFQEENRTTGSPRTTTNWKDSPYYSGVNDDPAESLRKGWEKVKAKWDDWEPEERNQALAWGGGGLLVLYLANGLINQIDRLPLLPQALQLVGFAFTSWFFFRYLLYADGREDLSKLSLDKLLGRASEESAQDFGRAFSEGAEGIADAGDRLRKSDAAQALKSDTGRLSDSISGGYANQKVKGNVKGALRDLDNFADDVAGR